MLSEQQIFLIARWDSVASFSLLAVYEDISILFSLMRILHVEASKGWGGQEIRILQEAVSLRDKGYVIIFGIMKRGELARRARELGFVVYELNFSYRAWIATLFRLLLMFRKYQIEVINTHSSLDAWIGGIAARLGGVQIVRTRHLSTPVKYGWNSRTLYRTLADFVVTTCEAIIEPLSRQSGQSMQYFRSIATGVNPEKMNVSADQIFAFRKENTMEGFFLVGTACFMRSWKGIEEFLQAASLLREAKKVKWVIIGGGHSEKYRMMARQMNLEEIVHFTGHLENPFPAMAALDIFALLSTKNEGVSQAILQAAFLKKALIATPVGGLKEVCLDQKTGLLVSAFCPKEVADAVIYLQKNPSLREQFGNRAHAHVMERFTFQHTIDGMEEVYRNLKQHGESR